MANSHSACTAAHAKLDSIVRGELRADSVRAIRRSFEQPTAENGRIGYTGRRFERFEGGGDRPQTRDVITSADVLAVTLLGVEHGIGRVAIATIEEKRAEITGLLSQIPVTALHEVDYDVIGPKSAAWDLWSLLCRAGGEHRSVTAYKLLARKRPALLPVYDTVVATQLGNPYDVWCCYWTWFDDDPSRVDAAEALRADVGNISDISLLRCLDVALWMLGTGRSGG